MKFKYERLIYLTGIVAGCIAFVALSEQVKMEKSTKLETKQEQQTPAESDSSIRINVRIDESLEQKNPNKRTERFNDENKVSYIYLCSDTGQIYAFLSVKGKVNSLNSLSATPDPTGAIPDDSGVEVKKHVKIDSPDINESYESNPDGIFFFTTDGTYCEWNGKYFLCDKPLELTVQPLMMIKSKE